MQGADVAILYEPERGRPLTIVRVSDRRLLIAAARAAISEADDRALALGDADVVLGAVQREEAERVRRVLTILVPELRPTDRRLELVAEVDQEVGGESDFRR